MINKKLPHLKTFFPLYQTSTLLLRHEYFFHKIGTTKWHHILLTKRQECKDFLFCNLLKMSLRQSTLSCDILYLSVKKMLTVLESKTVYIYGNRYMYVPIVPSSR